MKIIGIIPSRYQSSRFPGKPLVELNGYPMIWWVYRQCIRVSDLDEVYVATDDIRIENVCCKYNIPVIMTSSKHRTGTDRLGEVATKVWADYYVNIQGDEPLIEPETIQKVIGYCMLGSEEVINTVTVIKDSADLYSDSCVKVVLNKNDEGIYLSRCPVPYPKCNEETVHYKHLGLYGLSRKALLFFSSCDRGKAERTEDIEMLRFIENGYRIKVIIVDSASIAIDKPEDVQKVLKVMKGDSYNAKN